MRKYQTNILGTFIYFIRIKRREKTVSSSDYVCVCVCGDLCVCLTETKNVNHGTFEEVWFWTSHRRKFFFTRKIE